MKRNLRGDELKLWGLVTATVRPTPPKLPSEKLKAAQIKAERAAVETGKVKNRKKTANNA